MQKLYQLVFTEEELDALIGLVYAARDDLGYQYMEFTANDEVVHAVITRLESLNEGR